MPPIRTSTFRKASPALLFKTYRRSKVPEGGWTQEEFYSENGVRLVQDWVKMNRSATTKNSRMLARTLKALMQKVLYDIVDRMEALASISTKSQLVTMQRKDTVLSGVWGNVINEVLRDYSGQVQEAVQPFMQSTADDVVDKGRQLLGSTISQVDSTQVTNGVRQAAREVTSVSNTVRNRLNHIIQREYDKGSSVFDTIAEVRRQVPSIAAGRVPTIVRTELGRAADIANVQAAMEGTCTHMSVVGCETIERTYTYRGLPTCNIQNIPVAECMNVRFHPNHTGCWVPSAFRQADGSSPELNPRSNSGHGTFEEQEENPEGSSRPFLNPRPVSEPSSGTTDTPNPVTVVPPPAPPPAPIDIIPQGTTNPVLPITPENCGAPVIGRPLPNGKPHKTIIDFDSLPIDYNRSTEVRTALNVIYEHASTNFQFIAKDKDVYDLFRALEILPDTMESILIKDIPDTLADTFEFIIRSNRTYDCLGFLDGKQTFNYQRTINRATDGLSVHHTNFKIEPEFQGKGYAKKILRNQVAFYDAVGIRSITMGANVDVGSYAWARYGFYPTEDSVSTLTNQIKRRWTLFDRDGLTPANPSDAEALTASLKKLKDIVYKNPMEPKDIWTLAAEHIGIRLPDGTERKLGYHVLHSLYYYAKLDLDDPVQYSRFVTYLERSKPVHVKGRELYTTIDGQRQDALLHSELLSNAWGNFRADFAGVEQAILGGCSAAEALWLFASPESVSLMASQLPQDLYAEYLALKNQ